MAPARLIASALLMGEFLFAGVIWFLGRLGEMTGSLQGDAAETLRMVALAVGFGSVPMALFLRATLLRQAALVPEARQAQGRLAAMIVGMALLEGGVLFNLVVWLVTGVPMPNVAVAGLLVVVQLFLFPRE
jgi:nitroreductase